MIHTIAFQWYELWFKVLRTDLRATLADRSASFESIKLLRRGIELFHLFELQTTLNENVLMRDLKLTQTLRPPQGLRFSEQFSDLNKLSRRLKSLERAGSPELVETIQEYTAAFKAFRTRYDRLTSATLVPSKARVPSFAGWLRLPDLLDLQQGVKAEWTEAGQLPTRAVAPEHISADENMFITVHQCFELWFKVMLEHIDRAISLLMGGDIIPATHLLRRVVQVERMLVQQIQIPATMLPLDFARFREERMECNGKTYLRGLSPASGTESYQFRELEIVCGLRDDPVFRRYLDGSDKLPIRLLTPRQEMRLARPMLPDAFRFALRQRGIEEIKHIFTPADVPNPNADLAQLADALIDLDEVFRFWRLGHVSMVEKMIGGKSGTGFLGPEYLMETAGIKLQEKNRIFEERQVRPRFFEELWAARVGG